MEEQSRAMHEGQVYQQPDRVSKKRFPRQDVHRISNIQINHDVKSRLRSENMKKFTVDWQKHQMMNAENSPQQAAGKITELKKQQEGNVAGKVSGIFQPDRSGMYMLDGRSKIQQKRKNFDHKIHVNSRHGSKQNELINDKHINKTRRRILHDHIKGQLPNPQSDLQPSAMAKAGLLTLETGSPDRMRVGAVDSSLLQSQQLAPIYDEKNANDSWLTRNRHSVHDRTDEVPQRGNMLDALNVGPLVSIGKGGQIDRMSRVKEASQPYGMVQVRRNHDFSKFMANQMQHSSAALANESQVNLQAVQDVHSDEVRRIRKPKGMSEEAERIKMMHQHRSHLAHSFTPMKPNVINRNQLSRLSTHDDRRTSVDKPLSYTPIMAGIQNMQAEAQRQPQAFAETNSQRELKSGGMSLEQGMLQGIEAGQITRGKSMERFREVSQGSGHRQPKPHHLDDDPHSMTMDKRRNPSVGSDYNIHSNESRFPPINRGQSDYHQVNHMPSNKSSPNLLLIRQRQATSTTPISPRREMHGQINTQDGGGALGYKYSYPVHELRQLNHGSTSNLLYQSSGRQQRSIVDQDRFNNQNSRSLSPILNEPTHLGNIQVDRKNILEKLRMQQQYENHFKDQTSRVQVGSEIAKDETGKQSPTQNPMAERQYFVGRPLVMDYSGTNQQAY